MGVQFPIETLLRRTVSCRDFAVVQARKPTRSYRRISAPHIPERAYRQRADAPISASRIVTSGKASLGPEELPVRGRFIAKPYNAEHVAAMIVELREAAA